MNIIDLLPRAQRSQIRALDALLPIPETIRPPRAMGTPPTITSGAATAGGTLTKIWWTSQAGGVWTLPSSPYGDHFAYSRTQIGKGTSGAISASGMGIANNILTAGSGSTLSAGQIQHSFHHQGEMLEFRIAHTSTYFMVRVDDEYVTLTPTSTGTSGGSFTYYKMAFASRGFRRIDLIGNGLVLAAVYTEPQDTIFAATVRGPRVIVLGDSFSAPAAMGWHAQFADIMGWDDVWAMGVGSTGYTANNSGNSKTFGDRLASDVIAYAPDICIVLGSINDGVNAAATGVAAADLVNTFRRSLPQSLLIGGYNAAKGVDTMTYGNLDTMDAVKAAYVANGGLWLNPIEMPVAYAGGVMPSTTLTVSHSASRAGNTGTQGVGSSTTGIRCLASSSTATNIRVGSTVEIGTGSVRERKVINGLTQITGSDVSYAFDGALQYAHAASEPVVEVGPSYLTGRGQIGTTTGWGNADIFTGADGVHPGQDGHSALAMAMARLVRDKLLTLV